MQQEKKQPLQNAMKIIRKVPLNWAWEWIGLLFWKSYTWVYGVTGMLCGKINGWVRQHYLPILTSGGDTGEEMPGVGIACLGVLYKLAFFYLRNVTLTHKNWLCAKGTFDLFPCTMPVVAVAQMSVQNYLVIMHMQLQSPRWLPSTVQGHTSSQPQGTG